MYYFFEALLVGLYTFVLYLLFQPFIKNLYLLLLVVGFSKHLLGYFLGIHTWYCNYGEACISSSSGKKRTASTNHLLRDSLLESLMFLIVGTILSNFLRNFLTNLLTNHSILFVSIGVLLHLLAEKMMIHRQFCVINC